MGDPRSEGFSLVEMLVALALFGIVTLFSSQFLANQGQMKAKNAAIEDSQRTNKVLMDLIERDITFRIDAFSVTVDHNQLKLDIRRRQAIDLGQLSQHNSSYIVTYETRCVAMPAIGTSFEDLPTQLASARLAKHGRCLKLAACGSGRVPRVFITLRGSGRIPPYALTEFPRSNTHTQAARARAIGSAACYASNGSQLRVIIDSLYAMNEKRFEVKSIDRAVNIGPTALLLLPNEL